MKKANEKPGKAITRTIEQLENRKISRAERERLKRVAALPDSQIDTSDIPDMGGKTGWLRVHEHPWHPIHRILSRLVSIRLPEPDPGQAQWNGSERHWISGGERSLTSGKTASSRSGLGLACGYDWSF